MPHPWEAFSSRELSRLHSAESLCWTDPWMWWVLNKVLTFIWSEPLPVETQRGSYCPSCRRTLRRWWPGLDPHRNWWHYLEPRWGPPPCHGAPGCPAPPPCPGWASPDHSGGSWKLPDLILNSHFIADQLSTDQDNFVGVHKLLRSVDLSGTAACSEPSTINPNHYRQRIILQS